LHLDLPQCAVQKYSHNKAIDIGSGKAQIGIRIWLFGVISAAMGIQI